jgi:MYXO-CTERM domain-containing protein
VSGRTPFLAVGDVVAVTGRAGFVAFGLAAIAGVRRRRRAAAALP